MKIVRSFAAWLIALVLVAGMALATQGVGSSAQARVHHLESLVRCPSCQDLSVAQSNATASVALRHEIVRAVQRGESDTKILTSIESVYGPAILLSPATSGLGVLLWLVPAVGVVVFIGALWRLRRKSRL